MRLLVVGLLLLAVLVLADDLSASGSLQAAPTSQPPAASAYEAGVRWFEQADYDQAVGAFTEAVTLDPAFVDAWHFRGVSYERLGEFERALADYRRATALDPTYGLSWYGCGYALNALGRYDEAIDSYSRAVSLDPDCLDCLLGRAVAYLDRAEAAPTPRQARDDFWAAFDDYDAVLLAEPDHVAGRHGRGFALMRLKEYALALEDFTAIIDGLDPSYARAYSDRGFVYARLNQVDRALSDYRRALELDPSLDWVYSGLSHVCSIVGDHACAARTYRTYVERQQSFDFWSFMHLLWLEGRALWTGFVA